MELGEDNKPIVTKSCLSSFHWELGVLSLFQILSILEYLTGFNLQNNSLRDLILTPKLVLFCFCYYCCFPLILSLTILNTKFSTQEDSENSLYMEQTKPSSPKLKEKSGSHHQCGSFKQMHVSIMAVDTRRQ